MNERGNCEAHLRFSTSLCSAWFINFIFLAWLGVHDRHCKMSYVSNVDGAPLSVLYSSLLGPLEFMVADVVGVEIQYL